MTPLPVAPDLVPYYWPHVRPFIEAAMIRGGLNEFAEIEEAVLANRMLLWIAWDGERITASAVTQLNSINGSKTGTIVAFGGNDLDRFAPMITILEDHFRVEGCKASRILGRPGWARIYPDYKIKAIILERPL